MRKKLSLFACVFVLAFFAYGSVYGQTSEDVADGADLDTYFNGMAYGTLNITVDTVTAISSLSGSAKDIVFDGLQPDGSAIDLDYQYSFLDIDGGSYITLNDISVVNSSGSAITASESSVSAFGTGKFDNNRSDTSGGVLSLQNVSTAMFDGDFVFSNNAATVNGGAILIDNSEMSLRGNLRFTDNTAVSGSGGAVYVGSNAFLDLTADTVSFSGNQSGSGAYIGGGAVYVAANSTAAFGGDVEFVNNNNGNTSNSYGGAIFISPLSFLHFSSALNTRFDSNQAAYGGAVYIMNTSEAYFGDNTVFNNNFAGRDGGAVYNNYAYLETSAGHSIQFINNEAENRGGALFFTFAGEAVFNGDTLFQNNASTGAGGAIYLENQSKIHFTDYGSATFDSNVSYTDNGGALAVYSSTVAFDGAVSFNENKSYNSSLGAGGGAVYMYNSDVSFSEYASFTDNEIALDAFFGGGVGGGFAAYNDDVSSIREVTFSSTAVFDGNKAWQGAGFYAENVGVTFSDAVLFSSNSATSVFGLGGGFYANNVGAEQDIKFESYAEFRGNEAYNGGAFVVHGEDIINISFEDALFAKNTAIGSGGAFQVGASVLDFNGTVIFSSNTSAGDAGVFYAFESSVTFNGATAVFEYNEAETSFGGAGVIDDALVTFKKDVLFSNNKAASEGGALYLENSADINYEGISIFDGNVSGTSGGAVYAESASINFTNTSTSSFTGNAALSSGGAIYMDNSNAVFAGYAEFIGNDSTDLGGAVYALDSSIDFSAGSNVLFEDNEASSGGALNVVGSTLTFGGNTAFRDNEADDAGAFSISQSSVTFNGRTEFSENESDTSGGAIFVTGSDLGFNNRAVFSGNKAGTSGLSAGGAIAAVNAKIDFVSISSFSANETNIGGALFVSDSEVNLVNSYFFNNTAHGRGGAIAAAGTSASSYAVVNVVTSDRGSGENKTIFRGNKAAGQSNALYLGDYSSMTFTTNANASVEMYDRIAANSGSSYLTVSGAGKFNMGAGADIANLYITNGNFYLRGGQTLNVINMNVSNGSVFNMADHSALPGGSSAGLNTLNVTTLNLDGKLEVDGVSNDGAVNINAGTVNLGAASSLDVLTNITDKNYKKRIYKIFHYGALNNSFGGVTINDGVNAGDLSINNYFMQEDNWLLYVLEGMAASTDFSSLSGLSYNSKQVAKLFDSVTESGNASDSLLTDIYELDGQADNIKKQGLSDMSGYFIANVIRSASLVNDNAEIYDRIKYQDFETTDMNGIWVQARGQYNKISSDDNSPEDYEDTMFGVTAGWDKMFDDQGLLIGAFAKYNNNSIEQSNRNSADIQGFGAGVYSGLVKDEWELKALISGNFDNFETHRKIRYLNKTADGEFDAFTLGIDIEGGIKTYVTESIYLKPFAGFEAKSVMYGSFKEENAGDAGLDVSGDTYTRGMGRIGIGVASDDDAKLEWNASLQGKYLLMGEEPEIESEFLGSGTTFKSRGAKEGSTLLGVSGGISYKVMENIKLYANASYYTSDSYQSVYGQVGVRYMFLQSGNKFKIMK